MNIFRIIRYLLFIVLTAGCGQLQTASTGWTPLMIAACEGQLETAHRLIKEGASVNARTVSGKTALIIASEMGHAAVVRVLLETGADTRAAEETGETSLVHASFEGHVEVAKLLMVHGTEKRDITAALIAATGQGRIEMIRLLVENGADVNARNGYGISPLLVAAHKNRVDVIALLRRYGAKN